MNEPRPTGALNNQALIREQCGVSYLKAGSFNFIFNGVILDSSITRSSFLYILSPNVTFGLIINHLVATICQKMRDFRPEVVIGAMPRS